MSTVRTYAERPGTYAVRLAKGAVEVACRITHEPTRDPITGEALDRSHYWSIFINGSLVHCSPMPYPRLLIGREIDEAEYQYLLADRAWAAEHAPALPEAQPRRAINVNSMPPIF